MIKNAILYRIAPEFFISSDLFANNMEAAAFAPCGATQEISAGWVPPRGEAYGALVESIGGHLIAKLAIETKAVPSELVKRKARGRRAFYGCSNYPKCTYTIADLPKKDDETASSEGGSEASPR